MTRRIALSAFLALLTAAHGWGQADDEGRKTTSPYTAYTGDYEVGAWSTGDRRRKLDYLEQQYLASDELLGGPVAKPGEITFSQRETAFPLNNEAASSMPDVPVTERLTSGDPRD